MIPGIVAGSPVAGQDAVSFVAATGANYVASATTISTPSSPAGIQNGDGLFAVLFARSALSPPAGWSLVASHPNTGTLTQTLFIYRKDVVTLADASTSFVWSQSASGRMGLAYIVARSSSGSISVAQVSSTETDYSTLTAYPQSVVVPTLEAAEHGELYLIAATAESGSSIIEDGAWTASAGATLRTLSPLAENRLAAATQPRNLGQSNASPMMAGIVTTPSSANYYSAITVRLAP